MAANWATNPVLFGKMSADEWETSEIIVLAGIKANLNLFSALIKKKLVLQKMMNVSPVIREIILKTLISIFDFHGYQRFEANFQNESTC